MAVAIVMAGYLGLNPPGFAARYGGAGLRYRGFVAVPGHHDGHLLQEDEQGRRHRRHAWRAWASPCSTCSRTRASSSSRAPDFTDLIGGPNSFFGITPEAFGAIGALVNFAVAFAVDKGDQGAARAHPAHGRGCFAFRAVPRR